MEVSVDSELLKGFRNWHACSDCVDNSSPAVVPRQKPIVVICIWWAEHRVQSEAEVIKPPAGHSA